MARTPPEPSARAHKNSQEFREASERVCRALGGVPRETHAGLLLALRGWWGANL
jgi:hypothetical protein